MSSEATHVVKGTGMKRSLFSFRNKKGIIVRSDVLDPDAYMPPVLIGRDEQIEELAYHMTPIFQKGVPNNALIFGSTGCGKTATTQYVLSALDEELLCEPVGVNIVHVCFSCKEVYTTNAILYKLIQFLDPDTEIKRSGYSMDYYYDALYSLMNSQNKSMIVVLDEIDFIKKYDVLYSFSRAISSGKFTGNRFIRIIGISNSRKFENKLDPRILSSVGFEKYRFPSYSMDNIYHILKNRIDLALTPGSTDDDTILVCAQESAKTGGDIRKALNVLQTAARTAEREGANKITVEHIKDAEERVQSTNIINAVLELPLHHRIVLMSILKFKNNKKYSTTGNITSMYESLCKKIGEKPSVRQTVTDWITSLDMQGYITAVTVNKGGKTRMISVPDDEIEQTEKALLEDDQLEELVDYCPVIEGVME
jgi:cell division control protein 6